MEHNLNKLRFSLIAQAVSMLLFVGLLRIAVWYIDTGSVAWVRVVLMMLPLVPGAFMVISVTATIMAQDEMMRKVNLEATSIAFGGVFLLTMGEALMVGVDIPAVHPFLRIVIMSVLWLLAVIVAQRKYA